MSTHAIRAEMSLHDIMGHESLSGEALHSDDGQTKQMGIMLTGGNRVLKETYYGVFPNSGGYLGHV